MQGMLPLTGENVSAGIAAHVTDLRQRYNEAVKSTAWKPGTARRRFTEYDQYRALFCREIEAWLYRGNPRATYSLCALAWKVTHEVVNDGGRGLKCWTWSDRNQRAYLGDGFLEYLGLLREAVKASQERKPPVTTTANQTPT